MGRDAPGRDGSSIWSRCGTCKALLRGLESYPGFDAQKAAGISGHTLHDLRHTYAVNALKKGYKPTVIARQLGHKDASMIDKVYGRFIPGESDYIVAGREKTAFSRRR